MSDDPGKPDRRLVIRTWLYVIAVNVVIWGAIAFIVWRIFA